MASSKESDEFDQAEPRLRQAAEAGDVGAAVRLAFGYDQRGLTEEAFSWGLLVVDSGDIYAMMLLTGISRSSGYLSRDQRARDRWLAEAAEQGCWDAAVQLAHSLRQQGRIAEGEWVFCGEDLLYFGDPTSTSHTLDRDEQRDSWRRAAEEGDGAAAATLGKDFADEGLVEEASEWLERAGDEAGADAMMSLAKLCAGEDRKAWLRKAFGRGEPLAAAYLGNEFAGEGHLHEAQRWYQNALARGIERDVVARDLGEVLFRLGRIDEAEQWARQAAESSQAGSPDWDLLADVLEQQGKQEEAAEWRKRSQQIRLSAHGSSQDLGTLVAVAVFATAVVPFVKALVTKAGEDSYAGARAMVKMLFRRARPKKSGRRGPHGRLLIIEDPDPKLNIAIWLGTDTPDHALRALNDLDLDAIVDDSRRRRESSIRIHWDETDKTWKVYDQ